MEPETRRQAKLGKEQTQPSSRKGKGKAQVAPQGGNVGRQRGDGTGLEERVAIISLRGVFFFRPEKWCSYWVVAYISCWRRRRAIWGWMHSTPYSMSRTKVGIVVFKA